MSLLTSLYGFTADDAERNLDTEPSVIEEITKAVLTMQANAARAQHRLLRRGTHAKGVCARGQFEVLDVRAGYDPALASRIAIGIYTWPGTYPAIVRFGNSDPNVNPDSKPDVRSLSFSIEYAPGDAAVAVEKITRQDYSLQSATTLPLNDANTFLATMKVLSAPNQLRALLSLSGEDKLRVIRTMARAQVQVHQPIRPYQQLRYWSNVPFRHGQKDVVKYGAMPRSDNQAHPLEKSNPNCLQDELVRHLNEDSQVSSFDFGLQFLDPEKMTWKGKRRDASFWTENASVEWDETQSPFHTVGRLTLLPKSQLSAEAGEAIYFDVTGNSTPDTTPLGSINRARWQGEAASRKTRMGVPRAAGIRRQLGRREFGGYMVAATDLRLAPEARRHSNCGCLVDPNRQIHAGSERQRRLRRLRQPLHYWHNVIHHEEQGNQCEYFHGLGGAQQQERNERYSRTGVHR